MGEGYRIVAASRGVRPGEKQAITRTSPSHESLCWQPSEAEGGAGAVAFYLLPTGRACVAYSCYAGSEHTGRGGHRVYTHSIIFDAQLLTGFGYNPFHILRSMLSAGLGTPQLTLQGVLEGLSLAVNVAFPADLAEGFAGALEPPHARQALASMFSERALIIPVRARWLEAAELLLLGLPGPLRIKTSFAAGLRFSLNRGHRVNVLVDEKNAAKARVVGHPVDYVALDVAPTTTKPAAWATFVERHWAPGKTDQLARRTELLANECGMEARERIAGSYNTIDSMATLPIGEVLRLALRHVSEQGAGTMERIRGELVSCARSELLKRLGGSPWKEVVCLWPDMARVWAAGDKAAEFVQPLAVLALRSALNEDAVIAAEAALDLAGERVRELDAELRAAIDEVLRRLVNQAQAKGPDAGGRLASICLRWRTARPTWPIVRQLPELARPVPAAAQA
jgi:hypothetical protein